MAVVDNEGDFQRMAANARCENVRSSVEHEAREVKFAEVRRCIDAVDAEEEFNGEMPDSLFLQFRLAGANREAAAEFCRAMVRATKTNIKARILKGVDK